MQSPKRRLIESITFRSSHRKCSVRKNVLQNFAKFTGKYLCQSLFFNKVVGLSLQLYWKRDSGTDVFCEFCEIARNIFFTEHLWATASVRCSNSLKEKTSQRLNIPYRVLSKDALANNHVRWIEFNSWIE